MNSDSNRECDYNFKFGFVAGICTNHKEIVNEIKAYCFQHDLKCGVFKTNGFLERKYNFVIKGHGTVSQGQKHYDTITNYVKSQECEG